MLGSAVLLRLQRAPQRERERERERERRERERSFIDNPEVTERVDHLFQHNSQTPHQLHISSSSSRTVASLVLPDLQSSLIVNKLLSLSLSLSLSLPPTPSLSLSRHQSTLGSPFKNKNTPLPFFGPGAARYPFWSDTRFSFPWDCSCSIMHISASSGTYHYHVLLFILLLLLLWDCSCSIMHISTSSGTLSSLFIIIYIIIIIMGL